MAFVTDYFCWRVVVGVRFSSENTRPISPIMIPINWGNNVDVQHALNFELDPFMTAGQAHEILQFCEFRCLTVVVCVRFSSETTPPISPMMIPINWGNNVDVQCALHFDLYPSMTAGQGHKILWFLSPGDGRYCNAPHSHCNLKTHWCIFSKFNVFFRVFMLFPTFKK